MNYFLLTITNQPSFIHATFSFLITPSSYNLFVQLNVPSYWSKTLFSQSNTDFHSSFKSVSSMFPLYIGWTNNGISQTFHKTEVFVPLSSPLIQCFLVFSTLSKSMAWNQKHQNDSITNISPQRSKGVRFSIKSFN